MKKMIDKLVSWLYKKYMTKSMKKQQEQQKTEEDKKKDNLYKQLKELYNFVEWLNKQAFPNRHARKIFWRKVANNEPVMEETLRNIIKAYTPKTKKSKDE